MKYSKKIWMSQSSRYIDATKPIIFWDTCAILDILRIPYRTGKINELNLYEKILNCIKNEVILSVTSVIVAEEFDNHFSETCSELDEEQEKRKNGVKDFAEFEEDEATKININTAVDTLCIKPKLVNVVNEICENTILIRSDAKQRKFADFRLRNSIAPAAKKNEYKDCYIWGVFTTLAQKMRGHVHMSFFTSNKDDYYDKDLRDIYKQLNNDCNSADAKIRLSIGELYKGLREAGYVH